MQIDVVYEDADILAINKPAGLIVHGVRGKHKREGTERKEETLVDWLIKRHPEIKDVHDNTSHAGQVDPEERAGIVHRLDRETSGIMVIPKSKRYFEYLKSLFQDKKIKKTYVALVWGNIKENSGVIDKPIGIKDGTIKRTVHVKSARMIREAVTEYKVLKRLKADVKGEIYDFTLVNVFPKTGRTHQIRVHMASIGHPIVGDGLYGPKKDDLGLKRHFLHADSIEFTKLDGKALKISADLPGDLMALVKDLDMPAGS